jgi:type I restriction enzyme, R subunit
MDYNEKRFEEDIEAYLLDNRGYKKGNMKTYDPIRAIDLPKTIEFIKKTQGKQWERYERIYGSESEQKLYKRFNEEVNMNGLLQVLRKGIEDRGVKFKLAFLKPESTRNQENVDRYKENILAVTRQFAYSSLNRNTIDMVISLNGIPIIALELKNQLTGQSVDNGKKQFMYDRNPKELCFHFNKRFLVYFAVDLYNVEMTTHLRGEDTFFLPFNQGSNGAGNVGGAGNPENPNGYSTAYLWENVLQRDSLLNIIQRFLHVSTERKTEIIDRKEIVKTSKKIIFPRYHQLDVVTKIVDDVKKYGSGKNYLIQHSAGSGKSNSIAWVCYRLASLHDDNNQNIFTSVIIVTDRKVLDDQLQRTISSFDHKVGQVETIGDKKTSRDLRDAINSGAKIIVTTLQKFPVIYEEVEQNDGKRFAVIVDEAHSSQTGKSAQKLKTALAYTEDALEEYRLIESAEEERMEDFEDQLVKELLSHGKHKNLSFFAFTATPKQKTLEMFGIQQPDGRFKAFHVYSMKQAIEEKFILDVLKNYMTYKTCYKIAKSTPDNPELPTNEAVKAIQRYESSHPYNLQKKTEIIVEHFRNITSKKIGGRAKAMVVTSSRVDAVRYYQEFKNYIKIKGYENLDVLIAFSGIVKIKGQDYAEANMNKTKDGSKISEKQLPEAFRGDDFHMLIVAQKYQTGFDEPLLHTMFVDKKLKGVKAVQTLSRLNRTMRGKKDTFILDFANESEDILESFKPYYKETVLDEEINVNLIYDTKNNLRQYRLYNDEDIEKFNKIYYKGSKQTNTDLGKITSMFKPILDMFLILNDEKQFEFRKTVRNFVKWYSYISQITRMFDKELHIEYNFLSYLAKVLPSKKGEKVNLEDKVKLEYYKLKETFRGEIQLEDPDGGSNEDVIKNPKNIDPTTNKDQKDELLEVIIEQINKRYNGIFTEVDRVIMETIYQKCVNNKKKLEKSANKNNLEVYEESIFPDVFDKSAQECYAEHKGAYTKLFEDKEFYNTVKSQIARETYKKFRK